MQEPSPKLPLSIFECAPVKAGVVSVNIEVQSDTTISLVFSGNTYPFRTQFAEAAIPRGYANPEGETPEAKGPASRGARGPRGRVRAVHSLLRVSITARGITPRMEYTGPL